LGPEGIVGGSARFGLPDERLLRHLPHSDRSVPDLD
jgi:hypothetical protein